MNALLKKVQGTKALKLLSKIGFESANDVNIMFLDIIISQTAFLKIPKPIRIIIDIITTILLKRSPFSKIHNPMHNVQIGSIENITGLYLKAS